jgi:hypothetical protein
MASTNAQPPALMVGSFQLHNPNLNEVGHAISVTYFRTLRKGALQHTLTMNLECGLSLTQSRAILLQSDPARDT